MPKRTSAKRIISLLLGVFLLGLNIAGLFLPQRNPGIYHEKGCSFPNDITLTKKQLLDVLNTDSSDRPAYLIKATEAVNNGIAHYWLDKGVAKYNIRVPAWENYILYTAGFICPKYFRKYEYVDYQRAIDRGIGMCAQSACILADALEEKGIRAKVIGLSGHVVATAQVDPRSDKWWVLDPDYGVVIKHSIAEIEAEPDLISPYYAAKKYNAKTIAYLESNYGKEGNHVYESAEDYSGGRGLIERAAYVLKWALPVFLILYAGFASHMVRRTGSRQSRG